MYNIISLFTGGINIERQSNKAGIRSEIIQ